MEKETIYEVVVNGERRARSMGKGNSKMKLCPRCKLPMSEDDALNALAQTKTVEKFSRLLHDGKAVICSMCGQIEGLQAPYPARAEALVIAQGRVQAAYYGLDKKGQPKLPK